MHSAAGWYGFATRNCELPRCAEGRLYGVLRPSLSGSCSCLCEDAGGCDVCARGFAVDIALGCLPLRLSFAGGDLSRVDVACQAEQSLGQTAGIDVVPSRPGFGRHGDEQTLETVSDLQGQMVGGHLWGRLVRALVSLRDAA